MGGSSSKKRNQIIQQDVTPHPDGRWAPKPENEPEKTEITLEAPDLWFKDLVTLLGQIDTSSQLKQESPFFRLPEDLLHKILNFLPFEYNQEEEISYPRMNLLTTCKTSFQIFYKCFSWPDIQKIIAPLPGYASSP